MKKNLLILLFAVSASVGMMNAASMAVKNGECGDYLTWTLNSTDSTLVIEGSGAMTSNPWSSYKKYVAYVTLPAGLTQIMEDAFSGSPVKELIVYAETPLESGANSGINALSCKLFVPQGALSAYSQEIWWEDFASIEAIAQPSEPVYYYVDVASSSSYGYVSGSGSYLSGAEVQIEATPYTGYYFTGWNDGNTQNPRTITLTQDTALTAYFAVYSYNVSVTCDETKGWINGKNGQYNYGKQVEFRAYANSGYLFKQWSNGSTQNPIKIKVTQDTILEAEFDIAYTLSVNEYANGGYVYGSGTYVQNTKVQLEASPNTGYYFVEWNDGSTQNPRTITLTQDTAFTAQFAKYIYTLNVSSSDENMGTVDGENGEYEYGTYVNIAANPKDGYILSQWSDGSKELSRRIRMTANLSLVAEFVPGYKVTALAGEGGTVSGVGGYAPNTEVTLYANPSCCYTFTQWSDGNTSNPRTFTLTKDTAFTAQFTKGECPLIGSGYCGENLTWQLTCEGILTISGTGAMTDWYDYRETPWYNEDKNAGTKGFLPIQQVIIEEGVTSVGTNSFKNCSTLEYVEIASSVTYIGSGAFGSCSNLTQVICYPLNPPTITSAYSTFGSKTIIYIPCGLAIDEYRNASLWKNLNLEVKEVSIPYDVRFEVSNPELGHVDIVKEWDCATKTITAKVVTNRKVRFDHWSDGSTEMIYTLYPVSDTVITAYVEVDETEFTVIATADAAKGKVSGSGTYYYGDEIVLLATPNEHYAFRGWSDGVHANPRILPMGNYNLEAIFGERKQLNSEGKDFWVTFMRASENDGGPQELSLTFAALEPCVVTVENPYLGWQEQLVLAAGVPRRVTLDRTICYSKQPDIILHTALHVTSTKNVSVFAANYRTKSFDVANVLPCSDLKDEYYIQTYPASDHENKPQGTHFAIVAIEDSTIVDYTLTARVQSNYAAEAGVPYETPVLNAGEVYYIWTGNNNGYESDLSGSHVKARDGKPIAVFQGAPHTNIPYMVRDRDHIYTQAVPVTAWGNEFVVPSSLHHKRDIIRVLAQEDGTQVYVNGALVHTFDFVNGDDNDRKHTFEFEFGERNVSGDIGDRVIDQLPEPLIADSSCYITTSAPSSVHIFMTSNRYDNYSKNSSELGINDPAMLYINPVEQMVKEACFSTYSTRQINLHYINIIARADAIDDIVLKGNGQLRPLASEFRQVNGNPDYAFARVQIENDVYTLSGSKGFIAYVYGFGDKESYAFSVGGKSVYHAPKMHLVLNCDSIMGTVSGAGEYEFNEVATISASAKEGYEFVHWSDGNTDMMRSIVMSDDKELAALFRKVDAEPIEDVVVTPDATTAGIQWPEIPSAYSYCLIIWYDAEHTMFVCKLYYNMAGIRLGAIIYSYERKSLARRAPHAAEPNVVEFQDQIEGLSPSTMYYYTVTAMDEEGATLDTKEGYFTTTEEKTPSDPGQQDNPDTPTTPGTPDTPGTTVDPSDPGEEAEEGLDQITNDQLPMTRKIINDNQIFILRGDRIYTLDGQEIK